MTLHINCSQSSHYVTKTTAACSYLIKLVKLDTEVERIHCHYQITRYTIQCAQLDLTKVQTGPNHCFFSLQVSYSKVPARELVIPLRSASTNTIFVCDH